MFRTFLILILLGAGLSLKGQNQLDSQGRKTGHWKVDYPNGRTQYEADFVDGQPVGEMLRYYENGSLRARMFFEEGTGRSDVHLFYAGGKKAAEGRYVDQLKDSVWIYYSEYDGSVRLRESYDAGKLHGISRAYYPEGEVSEEVEWKQNVRDGAWKQYFRNGVTRLSGRYADGMLQGSYEVYYSDGTIEIRGNYLDNRSHGTWLFYDEKGNEAYALEYENGSPADREKYDMWIQDSLMNKYVVPTQPEFLQ